MCGLSGHGMGNEPFVLRLLDRSKCLAAYETHWPAVPFAVVSSVSSFRAGQNTSPLAWLAGFGGSAIPSREMAGTPFIRTIPVFPLLVLKGIYRYWK